MRERVFYAWQVVTQVADELEPLTNDSSLVLTKKWSVSRGVLKDK
jgi:hypothetical protein